MKCSLTVLPYFVWAGDGSNIGSGLLGLVYVCFSGSLKKNLYQTSQGIKLTFKGDLSTGSFCLPLASLGHLVTRVQCFLFYL